MNHTLHRRVLTFTHRETKYLSKVKVRAGYFQRWIRRHPECRTENQRGFDPPATAIGPLLAISKPLVERIPATSCAPFINGANSAHTSSPRTAKPCALLSLLTVHMLSDFHQTRNFHDVFAWEKLQ